MKELDDLASQYSHALRDGTKEMFELTNKLNVPIIVISAGLGDSIKAVMKHERVMYPNVQLVSNFLQHKNGMLDGFSEKQTMIHAFNKNETAMYYENALHRKNIILMGFVGIKTKECFINKVASSLIFRSLLFCENMKRNL